MKYKNLKHNTIIEEFYNDSGDYKSIIWIVKHIDKHTFKFIPYATESVSPFIADKELLERDLDATVVIIGNVEDYPEYLI